MLVTPNVNFVIKSCRDFTIYVHLKTAVTAPIMTAIVEQDDIIQVDDKNLKQELRSRQPFLVVSELER